MEDIRSLCPTPQNSLFDARHETRSTQEDWENWDSEHSDEEHNDDTIRDPEKAYGHDDEPPLLPATAGKTGRSSKDVPSRLKSRARQKAQNAQAGIRLVTDMTKLRRQQQQLQQQRSLQQQQQQQARLVETTTGKFVDLAALRALEGSPRSARPANSNANKTGVSQSTLKPEGMVARAPDLSPNDGPIVIGICLPEDDLAGRTIDTPVEMYRNPGKPVANKHAETPQPLRSVWSPDTDDGSPFSAGASVSRAASSVYSQAGRSGPNSADSAPPVPALPSAYHGAPADDSPILPTVGRVDKRHDSLLLDDMYDDVNDTPITLFEEDGSPASYRRMSNTRAFHARSLATTIDTPRSGWWDHIQTPFSDHSAHPFSAKSNSPLTPASAKTPLSASSARGAGSTVPAIPAMPAIYEYNTMPSDPATARAIYAPALSMSPVQQALPAAREVPVVVTTPATPEKPEPSDQWWARPVSVDEKKEGFPASKPTPPKKSGKPEKPPLGISTTIANQRHHTTGRPPTVASSSWDAVNSQRSTTPQPVSLASSQRSDKVMEAAAGAASTAAMRSFISDRVGQGNDRDREQGQRTPGEAPPPYEPPTRPEMAVRYRAVFPPGHPLRDNFPSSPGPMSPAMAQTMTSQGAIHMSNVPLTPVGIRQAAAAAGTPLPSRPSGALIPGTTMLVSEAAAKVERKRRRHEKEDDTAWRLGNLWRGRGCLPSTGCVGRRKGRESRKRRRVICMSVGGGVLLVVILVVVLVVTLRRKHTVASEPYSFWLNTTDFPPIPTGVTSVVGTDNTENVAGCVQPTTLWSCALPKEQQAANQPYGAEAPSFVLDIQFDNDAARLWKVPDGAIPTPTTKASSAATSAVVAAAANSASSTQQFDAGFTPQPAPPSFQEMWFLGNTTDGIVSDGKAGEPTPFYITFLTSVNATTAGANEVALKHRRGRLDRRAVEKRVTTVSDSSSTTATTKSSTRSRTSTSASTNTGTSTGTNTGTSTSTSTGKATSTTTAAATSASFPAPLLNADGTGAPAVMHPLPIQQPLRLYDRGLPTEHYGFYTYFSKTIYVQSITAAAAMDGAATLPSDGDGGSLEADANFVVTWLQTRFRVQIWTRMGNTTRPLGSGAAGTNTTQPGTFPYPISIAEDLHGGDLAQKGVFARRVTADQKIVLTGATTILDNLATGGTLVNHGGTTAANPSFGGTDGGTGGCKCVWSNFVGLNGNTAD